MRKPNRCQWSCIVFCPAHEPLANQFIYICYYAGEGNTHTAHISIRSNLELGNNLFNMKEKEYWCSTWCFTGLRCTAHMLQATPNLATVSNTTSTGICLFPGDLPPFKCLMVTLRTIALWSGLTEEIIHPKLHTMFSMLIHILCQNQSVINQSHAQPVHCKTTQLLTCQTDIMHNENAMYDI